MPSRHFRAAKSLLAIIAASSPLALAVPRATAATIYSTLGPGNTFDSAGFLVYGVNNVFHNAPQDTAGLFTVTQAFTLDSASAVLNASSPTDAGIDMQIVRDDSGHPGALIEDLGSQSVNAVATLKTYNSAAHSLLTPGTYWLVAVPIGPGTTGAWRRSLSAFFGTASTNYLGEAIIHPPDTTWTVFNNPSNPGASLAPAFEIDGTLAAAPLPNSAAAGLFLLTLAAAPIVGRRAGAAGRE